MAYKTKYNPINIEKYIGDPANIICRSLWERKMCIYLDTNQAVKNWSSEGLSIDYKSPIDNKIHRYYPDFIVRVLNKKGIMETLILEIKPEKQTKTPIKGKKKTKTFINETKTFVINKSKWEAADMFCYKNGWKFIIVTENSLFTDI